MLRMCLCLFAFGCSSPAPAPTAPTPPPPAPSGPSTEGLGNKCDAETCADGQTCTSYFGIAGPNGPEFKSCEIGCKGDGPCPEGTKCVTIADGPGQVCRP